MRLQTRYNRVNIIATVSILLISGLCYYFILKYFLVDQLDDDLKIEEQEFVDYVKQNKVLPTASDYKDLQILFEQTTQLVNRKIFSADIFNKVENENNASRQLIFPIALNGKTYKVTIAKSEEETDDLVELIVWITVSIVALLLIVLFLINRFMLNKLWLPFIDTLKQLQQFNVGSNMPLTLTDSNINEFQELNSAVKVMSDKVTQDYDTLKSFTENASHEMQTPLAVVNSKLDLLMQADNFSESQMYNIQVIHEEINRLSKLNKALLLLTKIDNDQFNEKEAVNISAAVKKILINYEELISAKQITLQTDIVDDYVIMINENLVQILISNLITNSIKHNLENGKINVLLNKEYLLISNTGKHYELDTSELFERFKKRNVESDSLGLGLSIVKKICDRNHFEISYEQTGALHTVKVIF